MSLFNGLKQAFSNLLSDEYAQDYIESYAEDEDAKNKALGYIHGTISSQSPAIKNKNLGEIITELKDKKNPERTPDFFDKILHPFLKNNTPEEDPAYQDPREVPESAIQSLNKYALYSEKDPLRRDWFKKRVSNWYDTVYGNNNAKTDAAGKIIEPLPRFNIPLETKPLLSKEGFSIPEGYQRVAKALTAYPNEPVRVLQKALNSYEDDFPRLKEDNDLGQKTTSRTKQVLANYGLKSLEDKLKTIA